RATGMGEEDVAGPASSLHPCYSLYSASVPAVLPRLRREAVLPIACGAFAALLVVALLTFVPPSGDAPSHLFQTWLYRLGVFRLLSVHRRRGLRSRRAAGAPAPPPAALLHRRRRVARVLAARVRRAAGPARRPPAGASAAARRRPPPLGRPGDRRGGAARRRA